MSNFECTEFMIAGAERRNAVAVHYIVIIVQCVTVTYCKHS